MTKMPQKQQNDTLRGAQHRQADVLQCHGERGELPG